MEDRSCQESNNREFTTSTDIQTTRSVLFFCELPNIKILHSSLNYGEFKEILQVT